MEKLISKGLRVQKPKNVSFHFRPEVYDWFCVISEKSHCNVTVLMRGVLEDFYDKHKNGTTDNE